MSKHNPDDYEMDAQGNLVPRTSFFGGAFIVIGAALAIYGFYYIIWPPLALVLYTLNLVISWFTPWDTSWGGPTWMALYMTYLTPVGFLVLMGILFVIVIAILNSSLAVAKWAWRVLSMTFLICVAPITLTFWCCLKAWELFSRLRTRTTLSSSTKELP